VLVADTPAEFVRQVRRIVDDPALGHRLAANGRDFVERHFSWAVIRENMRAAFLSLADSRGAHA
ncbi:MAG: glycosyltransferase, partial [Variibacter sp.]